MNIRQMAQYIWRTDWATKKSDWAEWRSLQAKVREHRAAVLVAKIDITQDLGLIDSLNDLSAHVRMPICIRTASMTGTNFDMDFSDRPSSFIPVSENCPRFATDSTDRHGLCQNYNCWCVWRNHKYHAAMADYQKARKNLDEFWDNRTRTRTQK